MTGNRADPMTIEVDVQNATAFEPLPDDAQFSLWVETALRGKSEAELTLRLVDRDESRKLNSRYRGQDQPTNVLSFPAELPPGIDIPLLGDIVICAPLVGKESEAQDKSLPAHWAHLVIHGVLHLLGHDHQIEQEAVEMEAMEVELLASLGFGNPYT
jgi:probable rRNA maturation factor